MAIVLDGNNLTTSGLINSGSYQTTTTGTYVDWTIPSGVKRVTVGFNNFSTGSTSNYLLQLASAGSLETSGYLSYTSYAGATSASGNAGTTGFILNGGTPGTAWYIHGNVILVCINPSSNIWTASVCLGMYNGSNPYALIGGGSKTLTTTLDRVRLYAGGDTFDSGGVGLIYE